MPGTRIRDLPLAPALASSDELLVSKGGVTMKITLSQLAAFLGAVGGGGGNPPPPPPPGSAGLTIATEDGLIILTESGLTLVTES